MIKKTLFCLIIVLAFSCDISDDSPSSHQELLPIESVVMPEEFQLGETSEINMVYLRPTNCHSFNTIYYVKNTNERTVAIISNVFDSQNCTAEITETETSFDFLPTNSGTYIFKFWKGLDDNGQDDYLVIEVPVIE